MNEQKVSFDVIELVGETSRMPILQELIKKNIGLSPNAVLSRSLYTRECVAEGCSLSSAETSLKFNASFINYKIIEYNPHDIIIDG